MKGIKKMIWDEFWYILFLFAYYFINFCCRTPRGCVDWNDKIKVNHIARCESHPTRVRGLKLYPRPLRCGDECVAPHAGAWIEIPIPERRKRSPYRRTPRGCVDWNPNAVQKEFAQRCRTPRGCVDWNRHAEISLPIHEYCIEILFCRIRHSALHLIQLMRHRQ